MTPGEIFDDINRYGQANQNDALVQKYLRYFKEGYDAWGLLDHNDPLWNEMLSQWIENYRDLGVMGFVKTGEALFATGKYEEGALAIRFLAAMLDQVDAKAVAAIGKWFKAGIANWAHVDTLCSLVLSPLLMKGKIAITTFEPWRASEFRFQRRASIVSLLPLAKKGRDIDRLIEFARPLMLDKERVVHQGVGWVLREAWKKDPKPVEALLLEFKDTGARLIFQYATEKMTPEQKSRFRKSKG